ncbi:hypothetical protein V2W45_1342115 [Cenococcum geophilum]
MLYLAAQHGNAAVAAVLLAYSAECDRVVSADIAPVPLNHDLKLTELPTRGTALQIACLNGHRKVVDVLLEGGASTEKYYDATWLGSPFMAAIYSGGAHIVRKLIYHGADPNLKCDGY